MRGEVLGRVERRRRWSADEKLAVVTASLEPGAVVATVARQFDVTRQQVYDWRRAARRGELGTPGGVVGFMEVAAGLHYQFAWTTRRAQSRRRCDRADAPPVLQRIAMGLMIICTAPLSRAAPRTNMNSPTPSATSSRVSMFSRM